MSIFTHVLYTFYTYIISRYYSLYFTYYSNFIFVQCTEIRSLSSFPERREKSVKRKKRKKEKREFGIRKCERRDANKIDPSRWVARPLIRKWRVKHRIAFPSFAFNPRSFSPGQPALFIDLHSRGFPFNEWGRCVADWQPGWKTGETGKGGGRREREDEGCPRD